MLQVFSCSSHVGGGRHNRITLFKDSVDALVEVLKIMPRDKAVVEDVLTDPDALPQELGPSLGESPGPSGWNEYPRHHCRVSDKGVDVQNSEVGILGAQLEGVPKCDVISPNR